MMPATGGRISRQDGTELQITGAWRTPVTTLVVTECIGAETYIVARIELDESDQRELIELLGGTP
jgi:hypothetical protein